jgi:hypothetical protein
MANDSIEMEDVKESEQTAEAPRVFEKRRPSRLCKIKEITEKDSRVRFMGAVVELDKNSGVLLIDDGDRISVISIPDHVEKLKIGDVVGIIGIVLPYAEGVEIRCEFIQDMNKLNKELYDKFMMLKESGKIV